MRACLFCPAAVSSAEDAWPLWLLRKVGQDGPGEMFGERGRNGVRTWRLAASGLRVRFVCRPCNNHWMSDLESRARAAMEPMLGDTPHTLSAEGQTTLAMWAIKGAMVHEALRSGRPAVFTSAERAELREAKMPPRTKVWIAKCVDSPGPGCIAEDLFSADPSVATQISGYVTTMAFGPLAFQVLNFRLPYAAPDSIDMTAELRPGPWPSTAAQIWPTISPTLAWPMSIGLRGEAGIEAFSDRWKPVEADSE